MGYRELLVRVFVIGSISTASTLIADTELNVPGHRMVWNDEFEGDSVDSSKWDVNVGINAWYIRASDGRLIEPHWFNEEFEPWTQAGTIGNEKQYYSPDQVTVDQGILEIKSERKTIEDPVGLYDPNFHVYKSGKMNTADEFQFTFGIVKMRAQLPAGQGMWPAFWMLNEPDPFWFWDDEIDIMEARGSLPFETTSAHHYKVLDGEGNRQNMFNVGHLATGVNVQETFNEYSLEWTNNSIQTMFNDREVFYDDFRIPQGPMFLIMNAAVGGNFDGVPASDDIFPAFYKVDWVRVWQPASTPSDLASGGFEAVQGNQWTDWNTIDEGNISSVSNGSLHGGYSVRIGKSSAVPSEGSRGPDLLSGETAAGPWRGFLNRFTAEGAYEGGEEVDPSTFPATTNGDSVTLSIPQSASSPRASGVLFREFNAPDVQGLSLNFSGTVTIEQAFANGNEAKAFIRIFNPDFSFTDVTESVLTGGNFDIKATIPSSGIQMVQIGFETLGPTGSDGRLAASAIYLEEDGTGTPTVEPWTGFTQTVAAVPGNTVSYGLLAANDVTDPLGPGAEGRLVLKFLDSVENVISETSSILINFGSDAQPKPFTFDAVTPANAAWTRLSIERYTTDIEADEGGSFIADATFLHNATNTELPVFTSTPNSEQTVNTGAIVEWSVEASSPTDVTYQWYLNGERVSTDKEFSFSSTAEVAGSYFVIATNEAGPVIGPIIELTVDATIEDTDGDQISDSDEINLHGTDPLKPDSDFDGISDYNEIFVFLTDPLDVTSQLIITEFEIQGNQVDLTFLTRPGINYIVEGSADLSQWQIIASPFLATDTVSSVTVNRPISNPLLRFFRVGPTN